MSPHMSKNMTTRFSAVLAESGMRVPRRISLRGFALLRDVRAAGGKLSGLQSTALASGVGMLAQCGLMRWVMQEKEWVITEAGEELLHEAHERGVMAILAEFEEELQNTQQ